jgi:hypothetical protein
MNSQRNLNNSSHSYVNDARWQALHFGLNQLTNEQIARIIQHVKQGGGMVCDTFNYDRASDLWCPLAIGLGVPEMVAAMPNQPHFTNDSAKTFIIEVGLRSCPTFTLNPISGIAGHYFHEHRIRDILSLCHHILGERADELRIAV